MFLITPSERVGGDLEVWQDSFHPSRCVHKFWQGRPASRRRTRTSFCTKRRSESHLPWSTLEDHHGTNPIAECLVTWQYTLPSLFSRWFLQNGYMIAPSCPPLCPKRPWLFWWAFWWGSSSILLEEMKKHKWMEKSQWVWRTVFYPFLQLSFLWCW